MNLINLDVPANDLTGSPVPNTNLGKLLAVHLAQAKQGPSLKYFDWALTLHKTGKLEIDDADLRTLTDLVEGLQLESFIKAPILRILTVRPIAS